jgi:hypothetical protein
VERIEEVLMPILKLATIIFVLCSIGLTIGCKPEVGSKEWCEEMRKKSKADWTANETVDYAKHCVFENKQ